MSTLAFGISSGSGSTAWNRDISASLEAWRDLIASDDARVVRCMFAPSLPNSAEGSGSSSRSGRVPLAIYQIAVRSTGRVERFAVQGRHRPLPNALDDPHWATNREWMQPLRLPRRKSKAVGATSSPDEDEASASTKRKASLSPEPVDSQYLEDGLAGMMEFDDASDLPASATHIFEVEPQLNKARRLSDPFSLERPLGHSSRIPILKASIRRPSLRFRSVVDFVTPAPPPSSDGSSTVRPHDQALSSDNASSYSTSGCSDDTSDEDTLPGTPRRETAPVPLPRRSPRNHVTEAAAAAVAARLDDLRIAIASVDEAMEGSTEAGISVKMEEA